MNNATNVKPRAAPQRIDFENNAADYKVAMGGAMGMSTSYIMKESGFTKNQVIGRLRRAGMMKAHNASRMDTRNGTSVFAKVMIRTLTGPIETALEKYLRGVV